jgi:hypothetical protein
MPAAHLSRSYTASFLDRAANLCVVGRPNLMEDRPIRRPEYSQAEQKKKTLYVGIMSGI